jgi:hypothetical protein
MVVTDLEFPRPVADMCADLAGQGFDVLDEFRDAELGYLVLQGPVKANGGWLEAFVRIVTEREHWTIEVRFEGMSRWIPTGTWRAYLDGEPGGPDLAGHTRFVRYRLGEAAQVITSRPQAERDLVRLTGPVDL